MPRLKSDYVVQDCKVKFKFFKIPRQMKIGFISWGVQQVKGKFGFRQLLVRVIRNLKKNQDFKKSGYSSSTVLYSHQLKIVIYPTFSRNKMINVH